MAAGAVPASFPNLRTRVEHGFFSFTKGVDFARIASSPDSQRNRTWSARVPRIRNSSSSSCGSDTVFLFGGPISRTYNSLHRNKVPGRVLHRVVTCSSSRFVADPEAEGGVVLPALELNAREAIHAIRSGKVIAVPTDTLYGFACDACSAVAIKRIYEIKGRQETKPLAICVADVSEISCFAMTKHLPHGLLDNLLPGPVTVVLRRGNSSILDKSLNPGLDSIGVRVPDSEFIRTVARVCGSALALTSANLSGQPSSISIRDFEKLWKHCALVYDGGLLPSGRAGSTVVDLTTPGKYTIIRAGSAREQTAEILERFCLRGQ